MACAFAGFPRIVLRDRAQVPGQFAGLDLLDPGVVPVSRWRPDTSAEAGAVTAVGRRRPQAVKRAWR